MEKIRFSEIEHVLKNHPKIEKLKQFLEDFFQRYSADFIILFGSSAKGNYNRRSDIDLLIVSNTIKGGYFEKQLKLQQINPGGIDFFLYSSDQFKKMVKHLHLIVLESLSDGMILYDKEGKAKAYKRSI